MKFCVSEKLEAPQWALMEQPPGVAHQRLQVLRGRGTVVKSHQMGRDWEDVEGPKLAYKFPNIERGSVDGSPGIL